MKVNYSVNYLRTQNIRISAIVPTTFVEMINTKEHSLNGKGIHISAIVTRIEAPKYKYNLIIREHPDRKLIATHKF